MIERTPLKRSGSPDDVAGAVLYLASDAASFITGEIIASMADKLWCDSDAPLQLIIGPA